MNGQVTRITNKGFGFILGEDKKEYFFHKDDFNGFWKDLDLDIEHQVINVTFEGFESSKGLRAKDVKRLDYPNN